MEIITAKNYIIQCKSEQYIIVKMLADYIRVVEILKKCTTDDVSEAQKQLNKLSTGDVEILSCLQQCLKDFSLAQYIRIIAAAQINSLFSSNVADYTQGTCITYFTNLLIDPAIPMSSKKELSRSLMYCIERCDEEYLVMWKQLTHKTLMNQDLYEVGLLLLTAFSSSQIKDNIIQQLDEKPFQYTFSLLLAKYNSIEYVKQITYIMQAWKVVVQYLLHFSTKYSKNLLIALASSNNFCQCLLMIYREFSTMPTRHFLYINDEDFERTVDVNEMKRTALQLHHMLLNISLTQTRNTPLYLLTGIQIQIYVNTLCFLSMQQKLLEEYQLHELAIIMIKILKCMTEDEPTILTKSWKSMIHFIILPFFYITEAELTDFQQYTASYIEVSEDCCEKQRMGILKTQAASYLERIADLSDKIQRFNQKILSVNKHKHLNQSVIIKYVLNFAIASIKHNLNMQFIRNNEFLGTQGLPENVQILPIQTAFLVLSIFSYCLENYVQQLQDIKVILCNDHIRKLPPLERARIFTFLAYNYEEVFGNLENQTLKYWVQMAFSEENHPTVTYCALDFISNSLQKIYNENSLMKIISRISTNRSSNFWSLLKKIVQIFCMKFNEAVLVALVQESFKRIHIQTQNMMGQQVKFTSIITHLLHIVRIISEKGEFISSKPQLKSLIWSVTKLYPVALANYFEDDVIKIINCFLFYATKDDIQNEEMNKFIPQFASEFQKSDFEPTHYYIAFNNYIMKGEYETTAKPIYQLLKKGLLYLLQSKQNKSESHRKKLPIAHALLLLQNILAMHGGDLPLQQIKFISSALSPLYPRAIQIKNSEASKKKIVIYDRSLLARALNLQFLCHMYVQDSEIIKNLVKYHDFKIYYGYDVSVLLSCIKIQILKQKQFMNLIQLLLILIRVIYSYIQMANELKIEQINEAERKMRRQGDEDSDTKIDEEQNQQHYKANKKKTALIVRIKKSIDYEVILAFTNTPFLRSERKFLGYTKSVKEVKQIRQQFNNLLNQLREVNAALFQSIVLGFEEGIKHKLKVISECEIEDILVGNMSGFSHQGNIRKKFRILKPKSGQIDETNAHELEDEQITRRQQQRYYEDDNEDQADQQMKWQRAEKKKREKNKKDQ